MRDSFRKIFPNRYFGICIARGQRVGRAFRVISDRAFRVNFAQGVQKSNEMRDPFADPPRNARRGRLRKSENESEGENEGESENENEGENEGEGGRALSLLFKIAARLLVGEPRRFAL